ncbi:hypothetical protein O6H91_11G019900 [Diphasiastrum complanatum]|uniref:Uncharacterized protein n=1 Tax=Diphasiastrum complanatum TaxID=34168 RepID=A0ACC2C6U5_DIPCM|nr:hypothetical protein O6H91_11G019900 [Diphasiastrum complanatum]
MLGICLPAKPFFLLLSFSSTQRLALSCGSLICLASLPLLSYNSLPKPVHAFLFLLLSLPHCAPIPLICTILPGLTTSLRVCLLVNPVPLLTAHSGPLPSPVCSLSPSRLCLWSSCPVPFTRCSSLSLLTCPFAPTPNLVYPYQRPCSRPVGVRILPAYKKKRLLSELRPLHAVSLPSPYLLFSPTCPGGTLKAAHLIYL